MFTTADDDYARQKLKEKYNIRKQKRGGGLWKDDIRKAQKHAINRMAENLQDSYRDQTWNQRKILDAPAKAIARKVAGLKNPTKHQWLNQVRHDDVEAFMRRNKIPADEFYNIKLRKVATKCKDAEGGKGCRSRSVWWHPITDPMGRCWRCSSKREI